MSAVGQRVHPLYHFEDEGLCGGGESDGISRGDVVSVCLGTSSQADVIFGTSGLFERLYSWIPVLSA